MKKLIALLAALALLAAACGGSDEASDDGASDDSVSTDDGTSSDDGETTTTAAPAPGGEAGQGGDLVLLQWQAPSQANNLLSNGTKDLLAGSIVVEPLAEISPAGDLVPTLATEIPTKENGGVSEDGTQITWTLRDDILWSDGTPLTAEDVVFSYEYCADSETGCASTSFTGVSTVVDNGDNTVTITFEEPTPYPYQPFVSYGAPVIQKAQMAECIGAAAKACSEQNFKPIGTGPYIVTELRPEDTVTYELNPNYRGIPDGQPFFGTVTIKGGGSAEDSARSVLEVGDADYAWNLQVAPEILAGMEAAGNGRLIGGFASSVEHISLNQTDPYADPPSEGTPHPLFVDNPDLHRALSLAINRDELVAVGYGPAGQPTCNIWPVDAYGELSTNNDWCLTQDVDEAKSLLDGLGYEDTDGDGVREAPGFGPLEFDYITSTNAVRQSNQELIQAYWGEIGVKANMLNADGSLFFDGTCASDDCIWKFFNPIQMYTNSSTTGPYGAGYVTDFTSDKIPTSATNWGGGNIYRINSAEMDALDVELRTLEVTDPRYAEIMIEMNDIAVNSAIIPLIHRANASAISNSVQGLGDLNGWDSEYWNIEEWFRSE